MPKFKFEVIGDERRRGRHVVSINPNLSRIVVYQAVWSDMESNYGKPVQHVRLLTTNEKLDAFWIQPWDDETQGGRKVHISKAGSTKMISAKALFSRMKWQVPDEKRTTQRCNARWDKENGALVVDLPDIVRIVPKD